MKLDIMQRYRLLSAKQTAERLYLLQNRSLSMWLSGKKSVFGNIIGVGIGEKKIDNEPQGRHCIKFYVKEKIEDCPADYSIEKDIMGIETDIEQIGVVSIGKVKPILQRRLRPAYGGVSIGHYKVTAGTLGCLVVDNNKYTYILSNNHVLANLNRANAGDAILQPGAADGGRLYSDEIGYLEKYVPINLEGPNRVDAAIAAPLEPYDSYVTREIGEIGTLNGTVTPDIDMAVMKCGRSTGVTFGRIESIGTTLYIRMEDYTIRFTDQLVIRGEKRPFSEPGDSGSVILNKEHQVCGLLFAGSLTENYTIANDIKNVERTLEVKVL